VVECTRRIEFDAAHRVVGHKNKCKYLHGHRYILEITATTSKLDEIGMVADFALLKTIMKEWIDNNFDHNVILNISDKNLGEYIAKCTGQSVYYLDSNPTAENIALHLLKDVIPLLFAQSLFQILRIKLYETPNCYVEVR
jgi:6-pyruvoyltetrahydropterin/6-carboxytetrahydropterin synthase